MVHDEQSLYIQVHIGTWAGKVRYILWSQLWEWNTYVLAEAYAACLLHIYAAA